MLKQKRYLFVLLSLGVIPIVPGSTQDLSGEDMRSLDGQVQEILVPVVFEELTTPAVHHHRPSDAGKLESTARMDVTVHRHRAERRHHGNQPLTAHRCQLPLVVG